MFAELLKSSYFALFVIVALGMAVFFGLLSVDALHDLNVSNFMGKNYTTITSSATSNVD